MISTSREWLHRVDSAHSRFAGLAIPIPKKRSFTAEADTRRCTYFSATAGRSKGRGLSSGMRGCRSSVLRITAWM